jgi:hypothetical protein
MGEIMGEYGSQVMSFMVELALLAVKTYRTSSAVSQLCFLELLSHVPSLSCSAFMPFKRSARRSLLQVAHSPILSRRIFSNICGMR